MNFESNIRSNLTPTGDNKPVSSHLRFPDEPTRLGSDSSSDRGVLSGPSSTVAITGSSPAEPLPPPTENRGVASTGTATIVSPFDSREITLHK